MSYLDMFSGVHLPGTVDTRRYPSKAPRPFGWTMPNATFKDLNDDERSKVCEHLPYSDLLKYGFVGREAGSPKSIYDNLNATMQTILWDPDPANRLDALCSHIKKADNRTGNYGGILRVENAELRQTLDETASALDAEAAKEAHVSKQPIEDARAAYARQRAAYARQIAPFKAAQSQLVRQKTRLEAQLSPSSDQVERIIVDTVLEDSSKFARNVVQLYGAFLVGLDGPFRMTKRFTLETEEDGTTQFTITAAGNHAAGNQYVTYGFKQTDSAYEMTWFLGADIGGLTVKIPTRQLTGKKRELTPEVQIKEANANCVETFTDQLTTITTYIAKYDYKGWYRTGPAFLTSVNTLLSSVHVAEDDVTVFPDTHTPRMVASHVVRLLIDSGYPFTTRTTGVVNFQSSFADMCL